MKKILAVIALGSSLVACQTNSPEDRTLAGAAIGAGTGAIIGGVATGRPEGALAGAAIGGVSGAVIGASTSPRYRHSRYRDRTCESYDSYGNVVYVR